MGKKNRKAMAKRRAQARQKRKHRKPRSNPPQTRPPLAEIDPPLGFRSVSITQAMMEYAQPIMEFDADPNDLLQIGMDLWNYATPTVPIERKSLQDGIIRQIQEVLGLKPQEAANFFQEMVDRKEYLVPTDIQPDFPTIMFVRKETSLLITRFDYDDLTVATEPIEADAEDQRLVKAFDQLDSYVVDGVDYGQWEDHFFSTQDLCRQQYQQWLIKKGVGYSEDFPLCVEIYLNFVYCYMHQDIITLQNVSAIYIEEFFADYLLRKMMVERPQEYTHWPPALKLFYTFLSEKGYLRDAALPIRLLDEFEPHFITILRERYR